MEWVDLFFIIIVFWLFVAIPVLVLIEGVTGYGKVIENVNCYDKYGNKINNVTCEEIIHCGVMNQLIDKRCGEAS